METYSKTTRDIRVTVTPEYSEERSDHSEEIYAFSYTILLENLGSIPAQLVNRHWMVFSDGTQIADVKGPGVVGEQPLLAPEGGFEYSSWTVVHDPVGSMVGTFTFVSDEGEFFDVEVPKFDLIHRDSLPIH